MLVCMGCALVICIVCCAADGIPVSIDVDFQDVIAFEFVLMTVSATFGFDSQI